MRRLVLAFALLAAISRSWAQPGDALVYRAKEAVFYGLDFSFMKLIHKEGFVDKNGDPMCNTLTFKYFDEWNEMFVIERKKYDITRYFSIPEYTIDLDVVTKRNKAYPFAEDCITTSDGYSIPPDAIHGAVKHYEPDGASGLGLVVFVESMNKVAGKCVVHVVFFDRADHTILKSERVEGSPGGMGFRNYWSNAINGALERGSAEYAKRRKGK